jgi:hypothetical protein
MDAYKTANMVNVGLNPLGECRINVKKAAILDQNFAALWPDFGLQRSTDRQPQSGF